MSELNLMLEMWREQYEQPFTPAQQAILDTPVPAKSCQELFDGTVRQLAGQRKASTSRRSSLLCRYRGAGGTKCAIGCHIDDAVYSRGMEGCGIPSDNDQNVWGWVVCHAAGIRSDAARRLAIELQHVHDAEDDENDENERALHWRDDLLRLAAEFNLSRKVFREPDVVEGFNKIAEGVRE